MKVLRDLGLNINEDIFISGLTSSSKLIEKDQCFIALQGLRSHGIDYINEAIVNGASCVLHNKKDYYEYGLSYFKGDLFILDIGKISAETNKNFDIKNDVFCSNINLENLSKIVSGNNISFSPFSKFPSVRRDLSFYVQSDINYDKIEKSINELNIELITSVSLFDVYSNKKDDKKSYSIYITFQHLEKTLTDFQIDKCIDRILTKLKSDFSIEIRDK